MVLSKSKQQTVDLSLKIASKIKFEDVERMNYYIGVAEESTKKINTDTAWVKYYRQTAEIYSAVDAVDLFANALLKEYDFYKNSSEPRRYKLETKLAILYARLNDKNLALLYFNKLWKHYNSVKDYYYMAQTKINIGRLNFQYGTPKLALKYYQEAAAYLKKKPDEKLLIILNTNIGEAYIHLQDYEKAKIFLDKARSSINKTTDDSTKSWIYLVSSHFYRKIGDANQAVFYAHEAEKYESTTNTFAQKNVLEALYKAYLLKKDYENSAKYFSSYDSVRDSLKIEEKAVNVEKTKLEYASKIKSQQQKLDYNQKKFTLILTICILVILLLILSIFMIRYKSRLLKIKLEHELKEYKEIQLKQELEKRNKELTIKTIKEAEQKELFHVLVDDLKKIQSTAGESNVKQSVNLVINMMNHNLVHNNWEEFELRFSNVYESFYEKLNAKHPDLSLMDKRICALIKLNLSTKEIMNITKSSLRSVENIRTRLRKKLGLTNSKTDLNKYLSDL
ncbi:hypothetical protein GCM10007332_14200 [Epilithonimonas arachidiradicis]|uniref:Tetratricopeptide repeat protein n=1 Tax=Epilithonimonas arachidiradicis TaxID=1617282 RepID=A0ABQ1X0F1_9FLAO|nr:hypothetical protein GCM10007332_14200 [Epilithonimonas arachidiradicis]